MANRCAKDEIVVLVEAEIWLVVEVSPQAVGVDEFVVFGNDLGCCGQGCDEQQAKKGDMAYDWFHDAKIVTCRIISIMSGHNLFKSRGLSIFVNKKQMRYIVVVLAALASIWLTGCGEKELFVVEGSVEGADAQMVTLTYYADGGLKRASAQAQGGKFRFSGRSARPTLAVVTIAPDNQPIATVIVRNGDEIRIEAQLGEIYGAKVSGNSDSETAAKWVAENEDLLKSGNAAKINAAIAEFVGKNVDKMSSTALLVSQFRSVGYESMADSLFLLLKPEVRTQELTQNFNAVVSAYVGSFTKDPIPFLSLYSKSDSIVGVNPMQHSATLLCFVDADKRSRDSIAPVLQSLSKEYDRKKLIAVELSTAPDSASWRKSIETRDTIGWVQTWLPGSVASAPVRKLGISRVPFFIVADSSGMANYRGPSITAARKSVERLIKK